MPWVADLHLHSHYSRATSKELTLPALYREALLKGIQLVGTGDFTHPGWRAEIRDQLVPAEPGFWQLRPDLRRAAEEHLPSACRGEVRFVLEVEISSIYTRAGKTRKNHNLVFVPSLGAADGLVNRLERVGNLAADGRPILGLDARDLLDTVLETDPLAFLVPAHIWTPWFSLLGSKSGFDSLEECFGDLAPQVFAAETGLSSDPAMNWRVSGLDRLTLISNSDAHSPQNLGREANLLGTELGFSALREALRTREGFLGTIEFFPEQGKYHLDGHRACGVRLEPQETKNLGGRCPGCGGALTVGVLSRVVELADGPEGRRPEGARDYQCLLSLAEVVAETLGVGKDSRRARALVETLRRSFGPELSILRTVPLEELARVGGGALAEAIRRVRHAELFIQPGYDGEYGTVRLFAPDERDHLGGQTAFRAAGSTAPLFSVRERTHHAPRPRPSCDFTEATLPEPSPTTRASGLVPDPRPSRDVPRAPKPRPTDPLADLDPEQLEAATSMPGPLLVVAGPGTGKTRTLVARVVHQIEHLRVPPGKILAITFTRQAALELEERLSSLPDGGGPRVTTFHGFGRSVLEQHGARPAHLADEATRLELLESLQPNHAERQTPKQLGERISLAKQSTDPRRALGAHPDDLRAFEAYEHGLASRELIDLDDLILKSVALLEQEPALAQRLRTELDCVVVDEYQDVSDAQARLVELVSPGGGTLGAIGDPDQAIYGFRGARPGHFTRFAQRFPAARTLSLGTSYRLTEPILRVALAVLGSERPLVSRQAGPNVQLLACPTPASEAEAVVIRLEQLVGGTSSFAIDSGRTRGDGPQDLGFGDVAVLTRTKAQQPEFVRALGRTGIPCRQVAEDEPHDPRAHKVALMTMHAAKGREFQVVFVAGVERGLVPLELPGFTVDPEEERRLLYVAVTRARRLCVISYANCRVLYGQKLPAGASRYLAGLPRDAIEEIPFLLPGRSLRARQLGLFD